MGIEKELAEKACLEEGCTRDMRCFGSEKPKGLCFEAFNRYKNLRRRELEKEELIEKWKEKEADEERFDPIIRIKESGGKERSGEDIKRGIIGVNKKMKIEDKVKVYKIYSKLAASWLELGAVIGSLERDGEEVDTLRKAKEKIGEGLETVLLLAGAEE